LKHLSALCILTQHAVYQIFNILDSASTREVNQARKQGDPESEEAPRRQAGRDEDESQHYRCNDI
jgi:hypothetical protein